MDKLIDCAFAHSNGKYYFFKGKNYARFSGEGVLEAGFPKKIAAGTWPDGAPAAGYRSLSDVMTEAGWDSFDAVLPLSQYQAYYFFKDNKCVKYESNKGVPAGFPATIGSNVWYDMWNLLPGPYDAAVYCKIKNKYYFFSGNQYLRITPEAGIDAGYPKVITEAWNGLGSYFPGPYNLVLQSQKHNDELYFFRNDKYVRFKVDAGIDNNVSNSNWAYPLPSAYAWPGLGALYSFSAFTLAAPRIIANTAPPATGPVFSIRLVEEMEITMDSIAGLQLVLLESFSNTQFKGHTRLYQIRNMAAGAEAEIVLRFKNNELIGKFNVKNAPRPGDNANFSFAMSSCIYDSRQLQNIIPSVEHMVAEKPDFMIWNGDTSYYVGPDGTYTDKTDVLQGDMLNQHHMFLRMFTTRNHPSVAWSMQNIPSLSTWDDHDFGYNNSYGGGTGKMTAQQVQFATEVFRTCWPNNYSLQDLNGSIQHSYQYGNVAFYLPDGRTFRNPDANEILGSTQLKALINDMRNGPYSSCPLKVVVLGTQLISTVSSGEGFYAKGGGKTLTGERMQLLTAFTDGRITGRILVLSGDVHFGELSWFGNTIQSPKVIEVTASPLLLREPTSQGFPIPGSNLNRVWGTIGNCYAMISVNFNSQNPDVEIQLRTETGSTVPVHTPASFRTSGWMFANARWAGNNSLTKL